MSGWWVLLFLIPLGFVLLVMASIGPTNHMADPEGLREELRRLGMSEKDIDDIDN